MARLTGNTPNTLRMTFRTVKKKAMAMHPSYAKFLGFETAGNAAGENNAPIAPKSKKRKGTAVAVAAPSEEEDGDVEDNEPSSAASGRSGSKRAKKGKAPPAVVEDGEETDIVDDTAKGKKTAVSKRGRGKKAVKEEPLISEDEA